MQNSFIVFFSLFLAVYSALNYYIGKRILQIIISIPNISQYINPNIHWLIFWAIAFAYIIGRISTIYLPEMYFSNFLSIAGAYWLAAMYYFVLLFFILDIVNFIGKFTNVINSPKFFSMTGAVIIFTVLSLVIYGAWNARQPYVNHYEITIHKKAGDLKTLKIVAVSDIHLGNIVHNGRLTKMVTEINALNPDIVLLPGDVIDENIGPFVEQNMSQTFRQLKSKLGTYAVLGNHEYIGGHSEEAIKYLQKAGITVLRDRYVKIADNFYLIGRDDKSRERFYGKSRLNLTELMTGIDHSLPIIVMDHQPVNLLEPQKAGVDLQLSGHTHYGQIFPNNLITNAIYEIDWGYLQKGNFNIIVSSGFGTWGPPVRIGTKSEILDIKINFAN